MVQSPGQEHDTEGGRKTQLQTDRSGGKGIAKQDHQQRCAQTGKRVAVPFEKGRDQQKDLHDAGTHHRGRHAHHAHIEQQYPDGHAAEQPPAVAGEQQRQQRHQKGTVQSGHCKQVGQSRTFHDGIILVRDIVFVTGQLRGNKSRHPFVRPYGTYFLLKSAVHPDRPPANAVRCAFAHREFSPLI